MSPRWRLHICHLSHTYTHRAPIRTTYAWGRFKFIFKILCLVKRKTRFRTSARHLKSSDRLRRPVYSKKAVGWRTERGGCSETDLIIFTSFFIAISERTAEFRFCAVFGGSRFSRKFILPFKSNSVPLPVSGVKERNFFIILSFNDSPTDTNCRNRRCRRLNCTLSFL